MAISAGAVCAVFVISTPSVQPNTGLLFDWWPVAVALLGLGLLIGRRAQSPVARLTAALGLAWISFIGFVVMVVVVGLVWISIHGGIGP